MKFRVERVRADHGYGIGWVILDPHGEFAWSTGDHASAFRIALWMAGSVA
jgi:hypothetical protein